MEQQVRKLDYLSFRREATEKGASPDSSVAESSCNAEDPGSIPGLGRSAGKDTGYPLQYFGVFLVAQLAKNLP